MLSTAWAQYKVQGTVLNKLGAPIEGAEIIIGELYVDMDTDRKGRFVIPDAKPGTYRLIIFKEGYKSYEKKLVINNKDVVLEISLEDHEVDLETVVITGRKKDFGVRRLEDVEGTSIFAGKKSEVILIEELTVNLAANNARQIYSQVAGLNIYENNDGGLQLNIGGRGLDPNRSANFNTRQNGYDISADVLGYPESYYTPPPEALAEIQVIRGASSLQYGTQFGGLVNFKFKQPVEDKKIELISRQAVASNQLFTTFNSISGTVGKFSYYTYFNYKQGNGFRPNSNFSALNLFGDLRYQFSDRTSVKLEYTFLDYLAKQPGGLTDRQFYEDPFFSNRERNWFDVNWNLLNLLFSHKLTDKTEISVSLFGLRAHRYALGFRTFRVSQPDVLEEPRDLIKGEFKNWGSESRLITRYKLTNEESVFLIGAKYYQSRNGADQGPGALGFDANFEIAGDQFPYYHSQSSFEYPNLNVSVFGENIFRINKKLSITPGWRYEYIKTESRGTFRRIDFDLANNPIRDTLLGDNRTFERDFLLLGIGMSYKPTEFLEIFGNISENYRSVTFNDIRVVNPSYQIDPDISDESGFTADLGLRGRYKNILSYDIGIFGLSYANRLGEVLKAETRVNGSGETIETGRVVRFRGNLGDAFMYGFESLLDWNMGETFFPRETDYKLSSFINLAFTESQYIASIIPGVAGNKVEFIPLINLKTGVRFGYKQLAGSFQFTYLSEQFTDASNAPQNVNENQSGIQGAIPEYAVSDLSLSYTMWDKKLKLEAGSNNIFNTYYFTRRATGYPGPGILPSAPRTFYFAVQLKL
ncbi:MAG: TonB-dependent receptor [Bacteroidota bacterium]